jgi:hypothetical protein
MDILKIFDFKKKKNRKKIIFLSMFVLLITFINPYQLIIGRGLRVQVKGLRV